MKSTRSSTPRWLALILVIGNIAFNYFQTAFAPDGRSIKDVSEQYANYFMPAPYAFGIWGLIYLSVLIYAIIQVLPNRKDEVAYHDLSFPLSLVSILSMCWLLSFTNDAVGMSEVIIIAMLITSVFALVKVRNYLSLKQLGRWTVIPFSLYAGWLSVATIANTSAWLVSEGYTGGGLGPEKWAIIMVSVAVLLGIIESIRFRDVIYPMVVAWGIIGIWASWRSTNPVGSVALVGGIILAVVAAFTILRKDSGSRPRQVTR